MPVTIGHEFSGEVVEIGSKASNPSGLKVGDKVAVQPTVACFGCGPCKDGYINCCDHAGFVGLSGGGGGMSDYVCVDEQFVFKLPDHIELDVGALVEPLAVAWHGVNQSPLREGDSAIVMGAGPIGLGVIQCLKARGAKNIIVVEIAKERQNFAKHFGATHLIDPRHEDAVKRAKEICDGQGPQVAFDAAGLAITLKSAALAVRARGTIVNLAIWEKEVRNTKQTDIQKGEGSLLMSRIRCPSNPTTWSLERKSISEVSLMVLIVYIHLRRLRYLHCLHVHACSAPTLNHPKKRHPWTGLENPQRLAKTLVPETLMSGVREPEKPGSRTGSWFFDRSPGCSSTIGPPRGRP